MPAPGEQHLNSGGRTIINPFEEKRPHISEYTAQEIATLQSKLAKQLGPEFLSSRAGPGGTKVHYVAAEKCIQLANEVFGFNGWSSEIKDIQVDFVDENPTTLKISLGLSVTMRVTLKDGTFHEDIGYGHIENCKGKAAAFEKAKKEGTTDGLKRALKNFGNVLGNCIYDKEYLAKVTKVKVQPGKWDVANLHRHADHVVKKEPEMPRVEDRSQEKSQMVRSSSTTNMGLPSKDSMEDEFGDFDEADFSVPDPEGHPDEVALPPARPPPMAPQQAGSGPSRNVNTPNGLPQNRLPPPANQVRPPINRPPPPMQPPNRVPGSATNGAPLGPQTPTPNTGYSRANSAAPPNRPTPYVPAPPLQQPSRSNPPSAPQSPIKNQNQTTPASAAPTPNILTSSGPIDDNALPPPGSGFVIARAVPRDPEGSAREVTSVNLPAFNPAADSPIFKKTPGVDHRISKPLARDPKLGIARQVKIAEVSSSQSTTPVRGLGGPLDNARRIGVPGMGSPMRGAGGYKAPTMIKRPAAAESGDRAPLRDLPANGPVSNLEGGDLKRQKLNG